MHYSPTTFQPTIISTITERQNRVGIPDYPYWMWKINYQQFLPFQKPYRENSLPSDSDEMRRIRAVARENGNYVSLSYSEVEMATLHLAQRTYSITDERPRRYMLRSSFLARGAGDTFEPVVDTDIGQVRQLSCRENMNPFMKAYAASLRSGSKQTSNLLPKTSTTKPNTLLSQVHIATWPIYPPRQKPPSTIRTPYTNISDPRFRHRQPSLRF